MLKIQLDSQRMHQRKKLSGLFPGKMLVQRTSRYMSGRAIDVSKQGMGVLSSTHLVEGDLIALTTPKRTIILRVNGIKKDYARSNRYRYSLVLDEESSEAQEHVDLVQVFVHSGCMA